MTTIDIRHCAAAAAVLVCLGVAPALAQKPARVGIVVAVAVADADGEAEALAAALGQALRQRLAVDTVAGPEVARRLPDGVPPDCVATDACVREVARRLDADELLFLVVVRVGQRVQIDPTWVNVATGASNARAALQVEDGRRVSARTWIAGGVAAAALAGGIGFALAARDTRTALDGDGCRHQTCDPARIDRLDHQSLGADLLFGTAAVAGATALYFYLTSDTEAVPVRVSPASGGATVTFSGGF